MLLVMDTGNTNTVLGAFSNEKLIHQWRIETDLHKTSGEYGILINNLLAHENISLEDIRGVAVSSVVPPIVSSFSNMCRKYFRLKPLIVGPGVKTGLNVKMDQPKEVGADRIVNAVAGIHEYGAPLIIVDFGTATTFCYINENNEYLGGVISPGLSISSEALFSRASKLPKIELQFPKKVIGTNTVHSMQSGVIYGYIGLVEGILARMKKEVENPNIKVVATGGFANMLKRATNVFDITDPHLTLKGLKLIFEKNEQQMKKREE